MSRKTSFCLENVLEKNMATLRKRFIFKYKSMTLLAGMYFGTSSDYVNTRLVKSDNV